MTGVDIGVRKVGSVAVIAANDLPHEAGTAAVVRALHAALDALAALSGIRAVVLMCDGSSYFSSLQINEFFTAAQQHECHRLFARVEQLPVPVVAAMHGTVLGADLGIALAGHYRVAAFGTRLGLLEVTLGLIPGVGCTQRLPRLIGVENSLELIIGARPVDTRTAMECGLLDEVIVGDLLQGAIIFAEQLIVEARGVRRTGDMTVDPASYSDEIAEYWSAQAAREYPNRMAPFTVIKAVRASLTMTLPAGLEYETRLLAQAMSSNECKGAVHALLAERETRRVPGLSADATAHAVHHGGVVGAGVIGGGIAICFANAGLPVTVIETDRESLDRGLTGIDRTYEAMVKRGRLTAAEKAQRLSLITGSLDYADLRDADVVIEAVFENLELKRQVFGMLEKNTRAGTVLASTTCTLNLNELAAVSARPADVVGMHFMAPAHVTSVLEVARLEATSAVTRCTAMDLARTLRKMPVLVRASPGLIGKRMLEAYAREAECMVLEGATPRQVDSTLEQWGMAGGVLASFDIEGLDVRVRRQESDTMQLSTDAFWFQADRALYAAGRLGRKNGKGYYHYESGDRMHHEDAEVIAILKAHAAKLGVTPREHSPQEILERCLYPLLNEGIRILEEGVTLRADDIDVVWIAGYGFPRYRGGPMFYADIIGLPTLLNGLRKYQQRSGSAHWQPAALLVELVGKKQSLREWQQTQSLLTLNEQGNAG